MNLRGKVALLSAGLSALLFGAGAKANDLPASNARAQARCEANYGPGFRPAGSETCVWVGGHLRVGFGRGAEPADNGWGSGGAVQVNAGDRIQTDGRIRLHDDLPVAR